MNVLIWSAALQQIQGIRSSDSWMYDLRYIEVIKGEVKWDINNRIKYRTSSQREQLQLLLTEDNEIENRQEVNTSQYSLTPP